MLRQPLLYPAWYPWFVGLAALDVVFTGMLLGLGGREVNLVAKKLIETAGMPGAIALKFATVALVVVICEVVGRRSLPAGRRLAAAAVALNSLPVVVGGILLAEYSVLVAQIVR
jgi:hypothetical protein